LSRTGAGDPRTDVELLRATTAGEREAFDHFVRRHQASVFRFARAALNDPDDAEDVLQETFVGAWRSAGNFRSEGTVRGWLFGIARNVIRHQRRRRSGEPERFESLDALGERAGWGADEDPERWLEQARRRDALAAALAALSPDDREILVLRDLEDVSGEETAELLGLSLAAMKSRLHRARLRLAAELRKGGRHAPA
jgi:RNA polymerase sigma-70 factor (ECF subfamily)